MFSQDTSLASVIQRLRAAEANYAEGCDGSMEDVLWQELQQAIGAVVVEITRQKLVASEQVKKHG